MAQMNEIDEHGCEKWGMAQMHESHKPKRRLGDSSGTELPCGSRGLSYVTEPNT